MPKPDSAAATSRYDLLDISRFFCAFWVMLYHYIYMYFHEAKGMEVSPLALSISEYGYMGVEFFFIISGFVIAYSSRGKDAHGFFESRFFRIWPTFIICMTMTAIVLNFAGSRDFSLYDYIVNLTVIPAYLGTKPYDGVYWTLAYEIFFYAIVFALILLKLPAYRKWLMIAGSAVLLALAPFALSEASYLALFVVGMAFHAIAEHGDDRIAALPALGLMSALAVWGAASRAEAFGHVGLVGGLLMAGLIGLFAILTLTRHATIRLRWARDIGLITYPLYLLHSKIGTAVLDMLTPLGSWIVPAAIVAAGAVFLSYMVSRLDLMLVQKVLRSHYRRAIAPILRAAAAKP